MIYLRDLRDCVVRPALWILEGIRPGMHSQAAEQLVMGTIVEESVIGNDMHLRQVKGPALGIGQIEPATHDDNYDSYLTFRPKLLEVFEGINPRDTEALVYNLRYSVAHIRLKYWRSDRGLPLHGDAAGMGLYWKSVYNSAMGKGSAGHFAETFRANILPLYKE